MAESGTALPGPEGTPSTAEKNGKPAAARPEVSSSKVAQAVKPPSVFHRFAHSGNRRHVLAGLAVIGGLSYIPWYYATAGKQQLSHQDYVDQAERAKKGQAPSLTR